jgi:hypothetical protein
MLGYQCRGSSFFLNWEQRTNRSHERSHIYNCTVYQTMNVATRTRNVILINRKQWLCFSWYTKEYNRKPNPKYNIILSFEKFCDANCSTSASFTSSYCSNIHFHNLHLSYINTSVPIKFNWCLRWLRSCFTDDPSWVTVSKCWYDSLFLTDTNLGPRSVP